MQITTGKDMKSLHAADPFVRDILSFFAICRHVGKRSARFCFARTEIRKYKYEDGSDQTAKRESGYGSAAS
jgi:hypothetical protein